MPWTVLGLAEQIDGNGKSWLWAVGPKGLARFDGETWQLLHAGPELPDEGYRAVTLFATVEQSVAEGAGAAGRAALLAEPETFRGRKVVLVLCACST